MAIIKTLKESKIVSKDRPRQTIYPVTSSDAVIVPNKGKLTTVLSKVAFSNDYNDLDNLPAPFDIEIPTNISAFNNDVGYLTSFTETDPTVPLWAKQNTKPSYNYSEILNTPILATVATSGNYNDLINKPTIPIVPTNVSAFTNDVGYLTQHQSLADYYTKTEVDTALDDKANSADLASVATSGSYNDLSNKPTIPTVPSNVSAFNNDAGYLTTESDPTVPSHVKGITQQNITNWNNKADSSDLADYYTKSEVNSALDDKQDTITDLATIRSGSALGATAYQKPNGGIPKSDLASSVQTSLGLADSALQQHQDLSSLANGAEYDSSEKKIYLKHGNTRLGNPIDATAFIKDGMIDTVTVTNGNLVISFNTDAGKQPISLSISSIFNANNYYTKTEIDNKGYLTSETDPIYSASVAASITSANIDNWNNKQNKIAPPEVGSLYRSDVSGSGSISIRGTKGTFPHVNYAGTYILITSMQSSTQSYGLSVNFGGNTYTLNTTNGLIEDTRQVTVNAVATWSGSVVGNVAANTIISVKILSTLDEITTVGMTAVTNSYNDLDNKPTIPTVYNGKLTIQKNGTQVATFTANQSGNATANIIVPTKVSELNNDSGFITGYTETDPVFTASVAHGITSSDIANWNSKTSNVGTITGITMNGASKGTSGVVDLGTVITEHQDISGKVDKETGKGLSSNDYTDAEKTKLSGIATGAEVNVQSDWNQTTTTADDYIKNKPSLATVATSGSYSDLSNKPTIPTVNNATLTIQKNGTTVGTFTANASSNVTANISVPTKVSDMTNDSGFITGYTETDPTVPAWAKASSKPTYTASEVGALPNTTVIPSKTSDLTNDSGFVTGSKMYIGTCTTAAATNPKDCTVETFPLNNGEPLDGTMVCVKFSATDTSTTTTPTINVNNTGAKRIWYNNALLAAAKSSLHHGYANRYIYYVYDSSLDGGNGAWVWLGCGYDSNTTYSNASLGQGYAEDTRSSAVAAVTASISSYSLTVGGVVSIHFAYDVPANATLNIRSRGAKAIYYKNAPITAGVIKAGDTATFIYTTYYHLISIDRSEGADLTNYYTKTEVDTALSGKQATLVSGTNLKTVNSTSLLGSGNVSVQPTLVSGTNIKTINNESLLGSGNITIQGGGGSANIEYNSSKTALVIGGGSTKYTISLDDPEASYPSVKINDFTYSSSRFPLEVNSGDILNVVVSAGAGNTCTTTMGGTTISTSTSFNIQSVSGNIVITVSSPSPGGGDGPIIVRP